MRNNLALLNDTQVCDFIIRGYHVVPPQLPAEFHAEVDAKLNAMTENPGDGILDAIPQLSEVYSDPVVRGALVSLLGHEMTMNSHRHWHSRPPGPGSQGWHQDGKNARHNQTRVVLGMYYPHDVTVEMGATVVMPGTHLRNAPTDRMASYGNLRGQVALTVKAGTVAITHYDIWHGGSVNRSSRVRHMLKFVFSRVGEPEVPSWDHDPNTAPDIAARKFSFDWACKCGQSDHYKEISLRHKMWGHMLGSKTNLRPGRHGGHSSKNLDSAAKAGVY